MSGSVGTATSAPATSHASEPLSTIGHSSVDLRDLATGSSMGLRPELTSVSAAVPPVSTGAAGVSAPAKPAEVSSAPPLGLIAGLALLTLLGGTMWYMVRQRAR